MQSERISAETHRLRVMSLRVSMQVTVDPRNRPLRSAVNEIIRDPGVARAVARGLRMLYVERP